MRRTAAAMLKLAARIVTTLLVLALLVAGAVYVASESSFSRHLLLPQDALAVDLSHGDVTRGRHLALAVSECLNCHGSSGGGTLFNHDFEFGRLYAPNLTRGRGGAAATFSDTDWVAAIRYGLAPDGRRLFIMPSRAFAELSDGDLADIVTYLRSIPPVDAALPAPRYGPLARVLVLTHSIHFAADDIGRDAPAHDAVTPGVTVAYGAYLTRAGSCFQCHGEHLSGGHLEGGPAAPPAQNLTPAGDLGHWTFADFAKTLRTGTRPDGTHLAAFMPWATIAQMSDTELKAIYLFLKSVPPSPSGNG